MEVDPILQRGVWHIYSVMVTLLTFLSLWNFGAVANAVLGMGENRNVEQGCSRLTLALMALAIWCFAWRVDYALKIDQPVFPVNQREVKK